MVAGMSSSGNTIKRTVINGRSVILLEGPPQILSWNEFTSIFKLFEDVEWFEISDITGSDFKNTVQKEDLPPLKDLATQHALSKETLGVFATLGIHSTSKLLTLSQDDVQHLKIPMSQKRKVSVLVAQVQGKPPPPELTPKRSSCARSNSSIDGVLAEHPKFWADHMSNSKLIKML